MWGIDMKNSFILYADAYDSIRSLEPALKGQLLDAIFMYQRGEELPALAPVVEMAFSFIRRSFERDSSKYSERCDKARESARVRWQKNNANACERISAHANDADSVTVTDTDTVFKSTDNSVPEQSGQKQPKPAKQPKEDRPSQCPAETWTRYLRISRGFHTDKANQLGACAPLTEDKVLDGAKALDNLIRIKGRPEDEVLAVLGWSIEDEFWSANLRSISALLKTSKSNSELKYSNVLNSMARDLERKAERSMAANG